MNQSTLPDGGWMRKLGMLIRLTTRLFVDSCVPFFAKILPVVAIGYIFLPDFVDGPFDDLIVFALCIYLFIVSIPDEIISKHKQKLYDELWVSYQVDPPRDVLRRKNH